MNRDQEYVELTNEERSSDGDDSRGSLKDFVIDDSEPQSVQLSSQGPENSQAVPLPFQSSVSDEIAWKWSLRLEFFLIVICLQVMIRNLVLIN